MWSEQLHCFVRAPHTLWIMLYGSLEVEEDHRGLCHESGNGTSGITARSNKEAVKLAFVSKKFTPSSVNARFPKGILQMG